VAVARLLSQGRGTDIGCSRRFLIAEPLDRAVQIPHCAKVGGQPLQFTPDPGGLGSTNIGEKNDIAVRRRVSATRIWCSATPSPLHVAA